MLLTVEFDETNEATEEHIRHVMLYEFKKGLKPATATKNIQEIYGPNAISSSKCKRWFQKFRSGNYSLKDKDRPGRPAGFREEELINALQENKDNSLSVNELAKKLNSSRTTVHKHLKLLSESTEIMK